ncbi:MAG: elongation factor G [Alphaproteobacteria bacterium]|nr:elongation factor G [Alphaproteobacteria bacterium]
MAEKNGKGGHGPRCVALVGPQGGGKTSLLESMLWITGTITRKGTHAQSTVGDPSAEARERMMSVEVTAATTNYLGDHFTFLDCPGSIEFQQETLNALSGVDAAVVVTEPDPTKVALLQPLLKRLADLGVPHFLFVNKIDKAHGQIRDLLAALQRVSARPLVLRQVPIWKDGIVSGFVDLALERAFVYREHAASEVVAIPSEMADREHEARYQMLEKLADYDDHLMEELLSDIEPPRDEVFGDLSRELAEGLIVPVLIGSAEKDNGVRRLLKALRHEVPDVSRTAKRQGLEALGEDPVVQVVKTFHAAGGKMSLVRVLRGILKDGATLARSDGGDERASGLFAMLGDKATKVPGAGAGDLIAIGRLERAQTGDTLAAPRAVKALKRPEVLPPVYKLAIKAANRNDDVKLSGAISKMREEDPGVGFEQIAETHESVLLGQGEVHLKTALARIERKFGLKLASHPPHVGYRETIRKPTEQRGRHKKQSGGHGQFGDVVLQIKPLPRGGGFEFLDQVTGGVVPRQFIPSVEKGIRDYLHKGPLGFPVVDVSVALTDGSSHSVDSSDAAFQMAAKVGMSEGMANCSPVLLEPVMAVSAHTPAEHTARINQIITGKRGQLLGFDGREGWPGWDTVQAHIPESELQTFIIELRSATQGAATFTYKFDHLAELTGKLADNAIASRAQAAAAA